MNNVGVFVCTGCDIGAAVPLENLEKVAGGLGVATFQSHENLCSPEGVAVIRGAVEDGSVDGVVIAACSHRAKIEEFRFDPTKVHTQRVCLREQVAWTQPHGHEDTILLAEDLLRMGVAQSQKYTTPGRLGEDVDRTVMVVGGGLAGLKAAQAAAGMGNPVLLVEASSQLGGYVAGLKDLVPEVPPYDRLHENDMAALVAAVEADPDITVRTSSSTRNIDGQPGQFDVELVGPDGTENIKVGAIVQATGARPYTADKLGHLGYGLSANVVTTQDLELMLGSGELKCPGDGKTPERVLFIQCAGSRDADHLKYCSSECCSASLRQVASIHRDHPGVETAVVYRDLRTPGQLEHFYQGVQELPGSLFTRGEVAGVEKANGRLTVNVTGSLLGDDISVDADLVVLATGMVPNAADGEAIRELRDARGRIERKESESQVAAATAVVADLESHDGTQILNLNYRQGPDLPVLDYNFNDSHFICFPYETRRTGIYAAGAMRAPMEPAQAAEDGLGAAMKAVQCLEMAARGEAVHPRAGDISVPEFALQRCTQCKRCTEECPFGTLNEDTDGTPKYNELRCRRCGICLGSCPERIISFPDYSVGGVAAAIKSIEVPDEEDEKPRVLAFMCENDALPAFDEAAKRGFQLPPWVRIIPVRCLGAVNIVWIADSLSSGIDGIMLMGCKKGDDYQCHYIRGSELADRRMTNVQETMDRLTLESERVKIHEVARNDYARIPEMFEEFMETIEEVGPNPYKGF
ncbi:MAG: hydrogenase iron-sulfur subunit [bacterium]|nr:hydrogenase iron-sulfur subunit [bacterium]